MTDHNSPVIPANLPREGLSWAEFVDQASAHFPARPGINAYGREDMLADVRFSLLLMAASRPGREPFDAAFAETNTDDYAVTLDEFVEVFRSVPQVSDAALLLLQPVAEVARLTYGHVTELTPVAQLLVAVLAPSMLDELVDEPTNTARVISRLLDVDFNWDPLEPLGSCQKLFHAARSVRLVGEGRDPAFPRYRAAAPMRQAELLLACDCVSGDQTLALFCAIRGFDAPSPWLGPMREVGPGKWESDEVPPLVERDEFGPPYSSQMTVEAVRVDGGERVEMSARLGAVGAYITLDTRASDPSYGSNFERWEVVLHQFELVLRLAVSLRSQRPWLEVYAHDLLRGLVVPHEAGPDEPGFDDNIRMFLIEWSYTETDGPVDHTSFTLEYYDRDWCDWADQDFLGLDRMADLVHLKIDEWL